MTDTHRTATRSSRRRLRGRARFEGALGQPSAARSGPWNRAGNCTTHAIVADPDAMKVASPNRGQPRFGTDSGHAFAGSASVGHARAKVSERIERAPSFGEPNAEADRRGNCAVRRWTRTDSAFGRPSAGGVHTTNSSSAASGRRDGEHGTLFDRANGRRERGAQTRGAGNRVSGAWTRRNDLAGHRGLDAVAKTNSSRGQPRSESVRHKLIVRRNRAVRASWDGRVDRETERRARQRPSPDSGKRRDQKSRLREVRLRRVDRERNGAASCGRSHRADIEHA